jgi:hypothetical protein
MENHEFNQNLELFSNSFKLTFNCLPCLSVNGQFSIMFEHLHDYFHPKDFSSCFFQLF